MAITETDHAKNAVRERIWDLLEREQAVPESGVHGRIPNFNGAAPAAERLAALPVWESARVIKAVPDRAQEPVRALALEAGRLVYMAVPKLADKLPFYLLDPQNLSVPLAEAADRAVAARIARKVGVEEMRPVDLVICGSVVVNRQGVRLGKGAGYSDIEVALLQEAGLISDGTTIVTTVHPLQVIDDDLPETEHDFRVDLIVTPDEVIPCGPPKRSQGLVWEHLTPEKIAAIPVLAARATSR
ncbi:5-formyltetrahydrofolate cyclo-ligase [Actinomadura sp. 6N118]|uniref:5-formyltetrahydrofolate cyclo-ligase n=1 Tax=Actinomadura sp. 6N118 TaxID=3375151 RepID=UPI00378D94EF